MEECVRIRTNSTYVLGKDGYTCMRIWHKCMYTEERDGLRNWHVKSRAQALQNRSTAAWKFWWNSTLQSSAQIPSVAWWKFRQVFSPKVLRISSSFRNISLTQLSSWWREVHPHSQRQSTQEFTDFNISHVWEVSSQQHLDCGVTNNWNHRFAKLAPYN